MWVLKNRLQHQATQDTHLCANRPISSEIPHEGSPQEKVYV
jgi:hypothetical protein